MSYGVSDRGEAGRGNLKTSQREVVQNHDKNGHIKSEQPLIRSQVFELFFTNLFIFFNFFRFTEEVQIAHDIPRLSARNGSAKTKNLK